MRTKKLAIPKVPRPNPVKYADELARAVGLEQAVSIAFELATGARNALGGVEGREIMDFMTRKEVQRSFGMWSSVAGYLKKRLEKSGHRMVERSAS